MYRTREISWKVLFSDTFASGCTFRLAKIGRPLQTERQLQYTARCIESPNAIDIEHVLLQQIHLANANNWRIHGPS